MSTIAHIIADVIRSEGGYVDDPADRGGATKYGITIGTLGEWRGRPVTKADVKALTVEEAAEIYAARYVRGPGFDKLPESVQAVLVDFGVTSGPARAIKTLHAVLTVAGFGPLTIDGRIGPKTIAAAARAAEQMAELLPDACCDERAAFYVELVRRDPSQRKFLDGWLRRAASFRSREPDWLPARFRRKSA